MQTSMSDKIKAAFDKMTGKDGDMEAMMKSVCEDLAAQHPDKNVLLIDKSHEKKLHLNSDESMMQEECELMDKTMGKVMVMCCCFDKGTLHLHGLKAKNCCAMGCFEMHGDGMCEFKKPMPGMHRQMLDLHKQM